MAEKTTFSVGSCLKVKFSKTLQKFDKIFLKRKILSHILENLNFSKVLKNFDEANEKFTSTFVLCLHVSM